MDEETNDSDMIGGQHGDQVDQDDDQTNAVRFEEINQKLDKLLALCPIIEDPVSAVKGRNTVNDLRNNQNEMKAELNNSRDMLQCVQQDLYSPRNDPDPEMIPNPPGPKMIPIFLLVVPEMMPKELGNGD